MFYNTRGDLIRTVDADGKETLIEYDARFRKPTRIQNALNNVTTMVYDVKGNLTSLTNAENETTTFTYTPKGQLATVVDPLTRTTSFTCDAEGNLLTSTNTANETVSRSYDAATAAQSPRSEPLQQEYEEQGGSEHGREGETPGAAKQEDRCTDSPAAMTFP